MVELEKAIKNVEELPIQLEPWEFNYMDALKSSLVEALKKDINSMSSLNISLSGVDSSLLLALTKELSHKVVCAYTVADAENHPDIMYSKRCCRLLNVKHKALIPERSYVLKKIKIYKSPSRIILELINSEGVSELMTGDGGDELMMGYSGFEKYFLIKELYENSYFPPSLQYHFEKLMKLNWNKTPLIYPLIYYWIELKEDLIKLKQVSEGVGIKLFLPYLDEMVIKIVSRIPPHLKLKKALLKKIASKYYPMDMLSRGKTGLPSAFRYLRVRPDKSIYSIICKYKKPETFE